MTKYKRLIKVLKQVGQEAFLRGYAYHSCQTITIGHTEFNERLLKDEFNYLVKKRLKNGK